MNKTKIEWCDYTWNPVTGCYHGCKYCYARKITTRFAAGYVRKGESGYLLSDKAAQYIKNPELSGNRILMVQQHPIFENIGLLDIQGRRYTGYPFGFCPTIHSQRLFDPQKVKKPSRIFVVSMGDLFGEWVPDHWIQQVFEACKKAPQHTYLFLTKNPTRYADALLFKGVPPKFMMGTTITKWENWLKVPPVFDYVSNSFLSIEPLLGDVYGVDFKKLSWVIVGAQTPKPQHNPAWVQRIIDECREANVPLFLKDNLGWPEKIQEYPS